jgi:hypothetical protein
MSSGRRAALIAGLAIMLPAVLVSTASGKGLRYVSSDVKDLPAGKIKGATVKCPDGSRVVGGGVTVNDANTATGVHSSYPIDADGDSKYDDGWRGVANSRSAGDKSFRVTAVCSRTGRYTYTRASTNNAPDNANTGLFAPCPSGQRVTGGGVELSRGNTSFYAGASFPVDADVDGDPDDGWMGEANNESGTPQTMATYAVCAKAGSYEYVVANSSAPVFAQGVAFAPCPAGTKITGGGGDTETNGTTAEIADTSPYRIAGPGPAPNDGWRTYVNNLSGVPLAITAFAVCRE